MSQRYKGKKQKNHQQKIKHTQQTFSKHKMELEVNDESEWRIDGWDGWVMSFLSFSSFQLFRCGCVRMPFAHKICVCALLQRSPPPPPPPPLPLLLLRRLSRRWNIVGLRCECLLNFSHLYAHIYSVLFIISFGFLFLAFCLRCLCVFVISMLEVLENVRR